VLVVTCACVSSSPGQHACIVSGVNACFSIYNTSKCDMCSYCGWELDTVSCGMVITLIKHQICISY
jgi:hypothetical protein